ncbi:hypothetical protein OK074_4039 [Actinobacteria bacterium OK074]|nr:hypothetical protein OK074_4039 [Actinobacteria bacterium OK074]
MTVTLEAPSSTTYRDPRELLNAVRPYVTEKTYNIFDAPGAEGIDLWEREVRLCSVTTSPCAASRNASWARPWPT